MFENYFYKTNIIDFKSKLSDIYNNITIIESGEELEYPLQKILNDTIPE